MVISAHDLYHSVGVNGPGTATTDLRKLTAALTDLGIRHVRQGVLPPADTRSQYTQAIAAALPAGVRTLVSFPQPSLGGEIAYQPGEIVKLLNLAQVELAEGVNEPDNQQGYNSADPSATTSWYLRVAAECPVPLIGPAFVGGVDRAQAFRTALGKNCSGWAQSGAPIGDCHPYTGATTPNMPLLAQNRQDPDAYMLVPGGPLYATEFGFTYGIGGQPKVDEATGAEYTLRSWLTHAAFGIVRSYVYTLMDRDGENWGLYDASWRPRLVVQAVKNFLGLIGDADVSSSGPLPAYAPAITGFSPGPNDANGIPDQLYSMPVVNAAGRVQVWVWRSVSIWDRVAQKVLSVPSQTLHLSRTGLPAFSSARASYPASSCALQGRGSPWYSLSPSSAGVDFAFDSHVCCLELS